MDTRFCYQEDVHLLIKLYRRILMFRCTQICVNENMRRNFLQYINTVNSIKVGLKAMIMHSLGMNGLEKFRMKLE